MNTYPALFRQSFIMSPDKIMVQFFEARMFKTEDLAALGIDSGHHMLDGAIFAGGIHRLKDQQHGVTIRRVEEILQVAHFFDAATEDLLKLLF